MRVDNDLKFCLACPFDAEEQYYSISHDLLLKVVKNCIEENGAIPSQNACGISVDASVDALAYHVRATCLA